MVSFLKKSPYNCILLCKTTIQKGRNITTKPHIPTLKVKLICTHSHSFANGAIVTWCEKNTQKWGYDIPRVSFSKKICTKQISYQENESGSCHQVAGKQGAKVTSRGSRKSYTGKRTGGGTEWTPRSTQWEGAGI